jgi:propionyl-CoA carboxylase alpha chain
MPNSSRNHLRNQHNISFLNALISHPRFRAGELTTNFIAEEYPDGFRAADVPQTDPIVPVAITAAVHRVLVERAASISGRVRRFDHRVGDEWVVLANKEAYPVTITSVAHGYEVAHDGALYRVILDWRPGQRIVNAEVNGRPVRVQLDRTGTGYRLFHQGSEISALVLNPRGAELGAHMIEKVPPDLSRFLLSPMPGLLVRLSVKEGQEAKAGEELAVVEAMKMENSLRALEDVTVAKVLVEEGESLVVDQPILEFA